MAYARKGKDSDIYLINHIAGVIMCYTCLLNDSKQSSFVTYDEAINHVKDHIKAGHKVKAHVIPGLERDRDSGTSIGVGNRSDDFEQNGHDYGQEENKWA